MGQPHQRHLEIDPGIGGFAHRDLGASQHLHCPHDGGEPDPLRLRTHQVAFPAWHLDQVGGDQSQKALTQVVDQVTGQLLRAEAGRHQSSHRPECLSDVAFGQCLDDLAELRKIVVDHVGGCHLVEDGQRVPGRPAPAPDGEVECLVGQWQAGGSPNVGEQAPERLRTEQVELEVLGAATDGRQYLLRVGGGQHEDDVGGRLLQCLQQRVRRSRREHVDLVDDVDLLPARGAQRGTRHQVAHRLHPVVRCGVELVHVEGGAFGDLHARRALPARLPVMEVGAVERFGEDPGGRGLAGPPRPAEQVSVGDPPVSNRIAKGEDDVVLASNLRERGRSEAPVQGLVGALVGCSGHAVRA